MRVKIGKYLNWWGPYQIANLLQKVGVSEDRCHALGKQLSNTWLMPVCEWIHSKRKRTVKVHIDRYDTWGMDSTLTPIILPMLKQLKATKHGSPYVDDVDVPDYLKSSNATVNNYGEDSNLHLRWNWVMDQMIWSFEQMSIDWEDQFHSGKIDLLFEEFDDSEYGKMKHGPNHTHTFDSVGHRAHSDRIDVGLRLFGKYFRALWD